VAVYRIDKFLGEGGFAYVYRARDTNLMARGPL
jgi:serine/threonine protein kinase